MIHPLLSSWHASIHFRRSHPFLSFLRLVCSIIQVPPHVSSSLLLPVISITESPKFLTQRPSRRIGYKDWTRVSSSSEADLRLIPHKAMYFGRIVEFLVHLERLIPIVAGWGRCFLNFLLRSFMISLSFSRLRLCLFEFLLSLIFLIVRFHSRNNRLALGR